MNEVTEIQTIEELIFITNTNNPLDNKNSMHLFYGEVKYNYKDLTNEDKLVIDGIIESFDHSYIDKAKLYIQVLPFHTDDIKARHRIIRDYVKEYLGNINPSLTIHTNRILTEWQDSFFTNGSTKKIDITLSARELHIPILVVELEQPVDIDDFSDVIGYMLDPAEFEEINFKFSSLIENMLNNYSLFSMIITEYKKYRMANSMNYKCFNDLLIDFVAKKWEIIRDDIDTSPLSNYSEFVEEYLTKIVIYKTIKNRVKIDEILKRGE